MGLMFSVLVAEQRVQALSLHLVGGEVILPWSGESKAVCSRYARKHRKTVLESSIFTIEPNKLIFYDDILQCPQRAQNNLPVAATTVCLRWLHIFT